MCNCEDRTEHDADAADDYVGDAEEGVLAAHYGACGDYDGFRAAVFGYVEIWGERELGSVVLEGDNGVEGEGGKGLYVLWFTTNSYVPSIKSAVSFLSASLLNVGRPARRIQT